MARSNDYNTQFPAKLKTHAQQPLNKNTVFLETEIQLSHTKS
jgi:hypothetical protein